MSNPLPGVTGQMGGTHEEFQNRCRILLQLEQAKALPDNHLIAILCDAVRVSRECCRLALLRPLDVHPNPATEEQEARSDPRVGDVWMKFDRRMTVTRVTPQIVRVEAPKGTGMDMPRLRHFPEWTDNASLLSRGGAPPYCCRTCDASNGRAPREMILCSECGNKRCPKATDHTLACTHSNEAGQEGSIYA